MDTTPRPLGTGPRPRPRRGRPHLLAVVLVVGLGACSPTPEPARTSAASPPALSPQPSGEPTPSPAVPTPDEHSAVGGLAEGFPSTLLPVPPDAEVLVSSYAPRGEAGAGQPYDVSLNLRTALPVDEVAALYRASLTAAGFAETVGAPTGGLAAESTYSRAAGQELITVGVLDRDDVRTVTVGGRLTATG